MTSKTGHEGLGLPIVKGLVEALKIFDSVEGFSFIRFTHRDVVRHRLVQQVVDRYDRWEKKQRKERKS